MLDIFTSCPSFRNYCAPKMELLLFGKTPHRLSAAKQKRLVSEWRGYNQIPRKWIFEEWSSQREKTYFVKAVATVEADVLVPSENNLRNPSLQFDSNLESQGRHSSNDNSFEKDEKERLRRMRISKANRGNVPWNKGRKHSPETLQRIRERTKIAMQDPKVKMKLVNLGHAQSEETRIKIGVGVREGWQRRREMLIVQERCLFDWQDIIAEASRKGYTGEDELHWDSYERIDEQLKQEWLESIEKRRMMPRPKGGKRAPKSFEQRRKISAAISAKWADPEYRGRVCSALSKYHGVPVGGAKRRQRRRPSSGNSSVKRESVKRKPIQPKRTIDEAKTTKKVGTRSKRNSPSYKDPMASSKLEMIRKIRAERATIENKKKEATERAKLLIAEAEKAAKALEVAALKSPLAHASLLETRKLIAEATRSIESIESGQLTTHDEPDPGDEAPFLSDASTNHFSSSNGTPISKLIVDELIINGSHLSPSDQLKDFDFDFDRFTLENALKDVELSRLASAREDSEVIHDCASPSSGPNNVPEDFSVKAKVNDCGEHEIPAVVSEKEGTSETMEGERKTHAPKTKKWVCGRLVEVDD